MTCKYFDCGWCYAPEDVENNSKNGSCNEPLFCPYFNENKMTEHKRTYKGIEYAVSQSVIDDLKNLHGVDAFKEIEDMLEKEIKSKEEND